jgi:hypothetical protein
VPLTAHRLGDLTLSGLAKGNTNTGPVTLGSSHQQSHFLILLKCTVTGYCVVASASVPTTHCFLQFENTVNKAVQDLNSVVSALNLLHTLEIQQQLQAVLSEARVSDTSLAQQLDQAHEQDKQQLQGQLEQLLGGQAELQRQLAAATKAQREEWFAVAGSLGQLAGDVGVIKGDLGLVRDEVMELRALIEGRGQKVRSHLVLDRELVQWGDGDVLDSGGFADVYAGTYNDHDVAVKLLRLKAFAVEQQREEVRRGLQPREVAQAPCARALSLTWTAAYKPYVAVGSLYEEVAYAWHLLEGASLIAILTLSVRLILLPCADVYGGSCAESAESPLHRPLLGCSASQGQQGPARCRSGRQRPP